MKARYIKNIDDNYLLDCLHIFAENIPVNENNRYFLEKLPGQLHKLESVDDFPSDCTYPKELATAAQNHVEQTETCRLAKLLELKAGPRIMLKVNIKYRY